MGIRLNYDIIAYNYILGLIHTNDFFLTDSAWICVRKNGLHRYHMGAFIPIKISADIFLKNGYCTHFYLLVIQQSHV